MPDQTSVTCAVCGATNPADAAQCRDCGIALAKSSPAERVDALLEDLMDLSKEPLTAPPTTAADETEADDVDQEVAEQLFDSLLVEMQPAKRAAEPAAAVEDTKIVKPTPRADSGGVERIPVLATPAETEGRKLVQVSGRMFDLVTFGTVGALVAVFVGFRMYVNILDPTNALPIILFAGVAAMGMGFALVLYHLSNSATSQGDRLVKAGRYQEALPYYERAIRMVRSPSYAWTSRGVAMKYLGRLDEARRCHENAIRLDPENEVAWCNLGTVYFKKAEFGKALECYDKAIKIRPRYAIAWNNKGVVYARMNRFEEAETCHAKATKLRPEYVAAWLNLGEVLTRLGAREQAQACLEKARSISRNASAYSRSTAST